MTNPHKIGYTFGILLGGFHLVWALLVMSGMAQAIYNFILWAHMIHIPITIGPFEMSAALTLIVITTAIGYIMGYIGALVWNRMHK